MMMTTRRHLVHCAAAVAAVSLLSGCEKLGDKLGVSEKKLNFKATDITDAGYRQPAPLPDQNGQPRSVHDFKGKVTVVFFGYTQCPDVCPTTMAELSGIKKQMGPDGDKLQVVFVSIDPERDTPQVLKAYMGSFDPTFIALRGTPEQTAEFTKAFKVFYAKVPGRTAGSYTMDHTAASFVIDTKGRTRLFVRTGMGPQAMQADIKTLLDNE